MKSKLFLFALLTVIVFACSEEYPTTDGLTKTWSMEAQGVSVSFQLWRVFNENQYRIKNIAIDRSTESLDVIPSGIVVEGNTDESVISEIRLAGKAFNLTITKVSVKGSEATADILLVHNGQPINFGNQTFYLK